VLSIRPACYVSGAFIGPRDLWDKYTGKSRVLSRGSGGAGCFFAEFGKSAVGKVDTSIAAGLLEERRQCFRQAAGLKDV